MARPRPARACEDGRVERDDDAQEPGPATAVPQEVDRIRSVYAERDARGPRSEGVQRAYRRLNRERLRRTVDLVEAKLGPGARLLDVGCGAGHDLEYYLAKGWPTGQLAGVDLVAERIALARERCPGVDVRLGDGAHLPYPTGSFDAATAVTVLSSIRDRQLQRQLFAEMMRVVRPGGLVMVYDFVIRNPRNTDVAALRLRDLVAIGGTPTGSIRLSPFLYALAPAEMLGPRFADAVAAVAPRTHRLTYWVVPG